MLVSFNHTFSKSSSAKKLSSFFFIKINLTLLDIKHFEVLRQYVANMLQQLRCVAVVYSIMLRPVVTGFKKSFYFRRFCFSARFPSHFKRSETRIESVCVYACSW